MKRNLLIAFAAFAPLSAFAAPVTYHQGDLLMGFRVTGNPGFGQVLVLDIGQAIQYRDAAGNITVGNIGSQLTALYGAGWHDRTDLFWGVAGSPSNTDVFQDEPVVTLYLTNKETSPGVPVVPPAITSPPTRTSASTRMQGMQDEFSTEEAYSTLNASLQGDADTSGWRSFMPGGANGGTSTAFKAFGNTFEGTPSDSLGLFRMIDATKPAYKGHFTISASGDVVFTPGAITPPPTGYAAWATANVGGQADTGDYDNDGIPNGVEYFMGSTTLAAPAVVTNAGVRSITWPRSTTNTVTSFKVQTSPDLVSWTDDSTNTAVSADKVVFTFPASSKLFVRLSVTNP